uniref:Putative eukaryotic translation initiation factor 3 subunit 7-like protein n=1 Tax=Trypanosoma congolense (strain IL3000) TaxID=1068625 RepID=G0UP14_TRYCI|nr:putative eukaryotic translation initiation factor 3 subunit 7-like protein [Trypanosoma congolense IL3000]
MSFELPKIHINEPFSWGPPRGKVEAEDLRVKLYQKADSLLTIDWLDLADTSRQGAGQFTMVDNEQRIKALRIMNSKNRRSGPERRVVRYAKNTRHTNFNNAKRNIPLLPDTVRVSSDVRVIASFLQGDLSKMQMGGNLPTVSDISLHNRPFVYDNNMDKANCKAPVRLGSVKSEDFVRADTTSDDALRSILKSETPDGGPVVVTTDEVLALMMTCSRSVHPWHLRFYRHGRFIFITKEEHSNIEKQWVDETADATRRSAEDEVVSSESIVALEEESYAANNAFVAQACLKTRYQMKCEKDPFPEKRPRLYRYRRYVMHGDTPDRYDLIVRCEVDAVQNNNYIRLFGLLEHCAAGVSSEWRNVLDSQMARCMSTEYRRNAQKMARWVSLCYLSGAYMKVGFITRCRKANGKSDPSLHEVLGTYTGDTTSLAGHLGLKPANMWATADAFIMSFMKQNDFDDAMLVKLAGEHSIRLIESIDDDYDDDEDDDGEDED